jgi:geranylgeranyl diphosphate synthase type II
LRMTLKKTCWYSFIHPCRIGSLIALGSKANLDAFNAFGFFLGAAFQIRDDILNLIGSRERYGKEIFGDIFEGKRTLMLARLANLVDSSEHARLSRFLSMPRMRRKESEVTWVFDAMERHKCVDYASNAAARLVDGARAAFPAAFDGASGEDRDFVAHCLDYITERDA